jgi:hypothetical protein
MSRLLRPSAVRLAMYGLFYPRTRVWVRPDEGRELGLISNAVWVGFLRMNADDCLAGLRSLALGDVSGGGFVPTHNARCVD